MNFSKTLVTICARGGSKGLPGKNIRPLLDKPLIAHTIEYALAQLPPGTPIVVSTDSEEIRQVGLRYGAMAPFLRPESLATDQAGKFPALVHALGEMEKHLGHPIDTLIDLDPTAPFRESEDLSRGIAIYEQTQADICFSVVKARKNPYFNMVERDATTGKIRLVKSLPAHDPIIARQAAPAVWDMNASIYIMRASYLKSGAQNLWGGTCEIFEMSPFSAFDIDTERDFLVTEALLKNREHH